MRYLSPLFPHNCNFRPICKNADFRPQKQKKSVKFSHFYVFLHNSRLYSRFNQLHPARTMKMTNTTVSHQDHTQIEGAARIFAHFFPKIADIAKNPNIVNPNNTPPIPINNSRFCLESAEFRSKPSKKCRFSTNTTQNTVKYCRNSSFLRLNDTI